MPNPFSPQEQPSPPVDAPAASPAAREEAPKPEGVNPTTAVLTLVGIVAFCLWKPDLARQIGVFLLTLGVLVFVHEWGHYQFARWAGMKVNRFGIGFPPWVYTKRHNGIDYSLGALPIGGMVDISGLGSEEEMVATTKGEEVASPTRGRNPNAPFGQRQFQDASLGWRFWTLFAGPMMNFLFAIVVFIGVYSMVGKPLFDPKQIVIADVVSGLPASKADLRAGDTVLAVDGQAATDAAQVTKLIRAARDRDVSVAIQREGAKLEKTLRPVMDSVTRTDGKGEEKVPLIGVMFGPKIVGYERISFTEAARQGWGEATFITKSIFGLIGRAATLNLTTDDKRGVGGPVKIAQAVGQSAQRGWMDALLMSAALSVNLGLLNLMPFPALDGGRILFLGYELVMRKPLDPRKEGLVHAVGMVMLLAFMLFITLRDVVPFFQGVR